MRSMNLHVPKGPGHKRQSAGSAYGACGVGWRAGQQLAWLTAKIAPLEWHVEVNLLAEVSMLWDHLASSRLTSTRRSRITTDPVFLRLPSCHSRKLLTSKLHWRLGEEKERQGLSPGMIRGPV